MKEINREEQQTYIAGVEALAGNEVTSASAIAKDLMNPTASDSLEVETDGEFLYNRAQVDDTRPNSHSWHGWGEESYSGNEGWGGAVRTVLLSGSHAELRALTVDSTVAADDVNAGHDVTVGHNLYVKNDAGIKGTLVISENADDPGYLDDISDDTGLYIDETKEENHIHNLEVVNLTASKADFDSGSFGDLEAKELRVTESTTLSGSTTITGALDVDAPSFFQTTSVFKKDVYVSGNLYVEGSASYINTDQLYIEDKSITVASGSVSPEAADGAGFDIDLGPDPENPESHSYVEFHYDAETDRMTLNRSLEILGTGSIIAPSGSINNLTSQYITVETASGYFTGSFVGDASGLTGLTMSVSDAPKCKHVLNIAPGGTERITHPFTTQNVIVQVYKWEDPSFAPDYQNGAEGIHAGGEDEVPAEVWDNPAIQVFDENKISVIVRPVSAEDPQNPYCVDIVNKTDEDFNGYVVIADAGIYVSGSGFVDVVEATREVIWFGQNPEGWNFIPQNGSASVFKEIYKGEEYVFEHNLGTGNILSQVYRFYPRYSENDPETIVGWLPVKYEPEYTTIINSSSVGIMFSTPDSGSFENGVQEEDSPLQDYFGYVVLVKAGSVVKSFEISEDAIGYFNIHWGNTGSWEAKSFTATNMSAEFLDSNDIVARQITAENYIDTPKIGNLNMGDQYYYDYYGSESAAVDDEGKPTNKLWGTFIEFDDGQITFHLRSGSAGESEMTTASVLTSDGDLYLAGSLVTNHSSFTLSDEREKDNIQTLTGSLENLMKLRGVSFEWHDGTKSIGTIAQEVRSIYPELTKIIENVEGEERISVNYEGLTGVLIEAVKTLADKVETLTQRIEQLEKNENR